MCTTWLKHKIIIEDWDNVIFIARSICKAMLTKKWDINNWKVKVNKKFIQKEKLCWINFNWHLTKYNFEQISFSWDVACYFPYIFGSAFDNKLGSTSYSVNPPPQTPCWGGGRGVTLLQNFWKGRWLGKISILRGGCWKRLGVVFPGRGGAAFS